MFVGITQIILYAVGLPVLVFIFLWRHRNELKKPVVKFRYGLFFAGFREKRYYWECIVALRKESTVLLAVFGPQMGIPTLTHVALLVFQVQILVQLIGHPYETQQIKLQVFDVTSIVICWGTMWAGFFFYSPRPPSQQGALEFLTMLVVTINVIFMLILFYSMCSETCHEHEDNRVVQIFRKRTSAVTGVIRRRFTGDIAMRRRRGTQMIENPTMQYVVEIEMNSRNNSEPKAISRPELISLSKTREGGTDKKKNREKNRTNKKKSRRKQSTQQSPVPQNDAQKKRSKKLRSLHQAAILKLVKRQSLDADSDGKTVFYTASSRVKKALSIKKHGESKEKQRVENGGIHNIEKVEEEAKEERQVFQVLGTHESLGTVEPKDDQ